MDNSEPCENNVSNHGQLPASQDMQIEANEEQANDDVKKQNLNGSSIGPETEPARGLDLIYQVATELATRIAEEKRYEGIIKPCSVSVPRVLNVSQFRIIRDSEMILDETKKTEDVISSSKEQLLSSPVNELPNQSESTSMQVDLTDSDDEEEMMIPPDEDEPIDDCEIINDKTNSYFCIFCDQKNIQGKNEATTHYQTHLDYYPYKCLVCLEVLIDEKNLISHFRKEHKDEKTATFKKKLIPHISDWIEIFLRSQVSPSLRVRKPQAYCPVCESSEKKEDIVILPPNLIQPKKQVVHIYKHLVYEPHVCIICLKSGKNYSVSEFDDRAYEHILRNHPEAEDFLLTQVYHKLKCIKPLEGFVTHYLTAAGVSSRRKIPEKIPNFIRNKFKAKQENKEKEKLNTDKEKTVTLGDLVNQSSSTTLLTSDQSNQSNITQSILKIDKPAVSNHPKSSPQSTQATPKVSPASSHSTHKSVTMLSPSQIILSPTNGSANFTAYSNVTQVGVNNLLVPNVITVSQINPTIQMNGNGQGGNYVLPKNQLPTLLRFPGGQIMVRNQIPHTSALNSTLSSPPKVSHESNQNRSFFFSPSKTYPRTNHVSPLNQQQKNTPINLQVSPDVETVADNPTARPKQGDFVAGNYLCIFCKDSISFESYTDALFHFSKHLSYYPVVCLLCCKKFQDLSSIMMHFNVDHNHEKVCENGEICSPLLYYINQESETENWIEENFRFQIGGEMIRLIDPDFAPFCPVCKSILNTIPPRGKSLIPSVEGVRDHLNLHLNYRPYECFLCLTSGVTRKYHSLGDEALKHIRDHGFVPSSNDILKEFFLHKPISGLEKYIKCYIITDYYPACLSNISGRNMQQNKPNPSTPTFSARISTSARSHSKSHEGSQFKHILNAMNMDNSPGPSSTSPQKSDKQVKTTLACYHCKLLVPGPRELLSHTKSIHPKLSIAAYALPTFNGTK